MVKISFRIALALPLLSLAGARAQQNTPAAASPSVPLAQRIAHTDPAKYHHMPSVHNGAGPMDYMPLYDTRSPNIAKFNLGTNLFFLHRGIIRPEAALGRTSTITAKRCSSSSMEKHSSPSTDAHHC